MTTKHTQRPQLTALCCECGTVRTTTDYGSRGDAPDVAAWARYRKQGMGWITPTRCTIFRKCATCRKRTKHAYLRDDDDRNEAEVADHLEALPGQLEMSEIFNEFRAMGNVEIIEFDDAQSEHKGVGVRRLLRDDSWEVSLYGVLPVGELVWRLRKIQERMRDSGAKWWLTCEDDDREPSAGAMWPYTADAD